MIYSNVFSQEYISGKIIYAEDGLGMPGVSICIENLKLRNCVVSNIDGEFRILKPTTQRETMIISFMGFETVTVENIDTIFHPITITMNEGYWDGYRGGHREEYWDDFWGWRFSLTLQGDILKPSFNNFESLLGKKNVDSLVLGSFGLEYTFIYRKFHFAFNHGHYFRNNVELDSTNTLKGDYRIFLLGTHFGYDLINSKRFLITPKIGVKWYRHRMINYDSNRKIPIEQYITNRDLDIRFNHLIGFTGFSCSYKFYEVFAVGFYAGYVFKLNDKPWVYSGNNRLITDQKIKFSNFNFGMTFSIFGDLF